MQKLSVTELNGFQNEFEMTCAAQDGNGLAWMSLWNHYKPLMMSRLTAVKGLTRSELESEACETFAYKLGKFNRAKVTSESAFSMFAWLYCAVINKTNKLIRSRKKDVHLYFEDVNASLDLDGSSVFNIDDSDEDNLPFHNQMFGINKDIYSVYNPEKLVVENLQANDSDRVKAFYTKLTQLDRDILAARREGLTLADVAKKFCCSITTIKNRIRKAKMYASDIFEVCYA